MLIKADLYPLLKLTLPLALAGLVQSSIYFFETIFLARLGEQVLAAGALASWLFGTIAVIVFGTLSSINVLIALKHGAKQNHAISLILRDGFILAVIITIPIFLLMWYMSPLFLMFGQSPTVVELSTVYLHALAWGLLADFIFVVCFEFLLGLGQGRIIMLFTLMSVAMSVILSYLLIFGKFGFPQLGIAGAGWGMTLSYWISASVLILYIVRHPNYKHYFFQMFTLQKPSYLWELVQVGVPMGLMYCLEVGFFLALALLMGSLGSQLLAANQITFQYLGTLTSVVFSIAQAITVRMGHLLGANEVRAAIRTNYLGVSVAVLFMSIVAIFYWFFPRSLIAIDFNVQDPNNFELVKYATQFLALGAVFQILEAARISFFGGLRALKDTHFTLLTSIISFWLIPLPLGYFLATRTSLGGAGIWWAMIIGAAVGVILLARRFKLKIRRYTKLTQS